MEDDNQDVHGGSENRKPEDDDEEIQGSVDNSANAKRADGDSDNVTQTDIDKRDADYTSGQRSDENGGDEEGTPTGDLEVPKEIDVQAPEDQTKVTEDEVQFVHTKTNGEGQTNEREKDSSYFEPKMSSGHTTNEDGTPAYFDLPPIGLIATKSYLILNGYFDRERDDDDADSTSTPVGNNSTNPSAAPLQQTKRNKTEGKRKLVRLFMRLKLQKEQDLPDFDDVLKKYFNEFMDMFEQLEPHVFIAPWTHTHPKRDKHLQNHITNQQGMYKRYLKVFTDNGAIVRRFNQIKFLRFQVSVPINCNVQDILDHIETDTDNYWWDSEKRSVEIAPSQGTNPTYICHFLRSCAIHDGMRELEKVLRVVLEDKKIGLQWKICDREKDTSAAATKKWEDFKANPGLRKNIVRALHVEVEDSTKELLLPKLQTMYKLGDYPLELNFDVVVDLSQACMRTLTCQQAYEKCLWHQEMFLPHLTSFDVEFVTNLDGFLPPPYRQITL